MYHVDGTFQLEGWINRSSVDGGKVSSIVVIPAKNEEATVGSVVEDVKNNLESDVLVVDDGSDDRTEALSREAGAKVLRMPFSVGALGALQSGMLYALVQDYDVCLTMDADGQHAAETLRRVSAPVIEGGCDLAMGVCPERASGMRRLAWWVFNRLTGLKLEDVTSGLRAYNMDAMKLLLSRQGLMLNYQDVGVLIMVRDAGLRVTEVRVEMRPRRYGKSRVYNSWWTVGQYIIETLLLSVGKWQLSWHVRGKETDR